MSLEVWKSVFEIGGVVLLAATFIFGAGALIVNTRINAIESKELADFKIRFEGEQQKTAHAQQEAAEANAKAEGFRLDIAKANEGAAQAQAQVAGATAEAAKANLELARITGKPYLITVKNGIAKPDLSQSNKQVIKLTEDTVVELPTLPRGKHLDWTLSLIQNESGGHRFKFSPDIGQFDPNVDVSPRSGWLVHFQTDETGTKSVGWGGVRLEPPAAQ